MKAVNVTKEEALEYHQHPVGGKLTIQSTKPFKDQRDLSLAYTPGVAYPCLEIKQNRELAYEYTAKGNLVGVVTNSTAVLGLGDIGACAGKPVMEGKGVLFKAFADVDVFDIELNEKDPEKFCEIVEAMEPTFGGINLEDIKAPECFYIEQRLKANMDIPVMHDDQHGTAIVSGAALLNALELVGKKINEVRVVVNGAGAAAIACAKFIKELGVEHLIMCDSKGVIRKGRAGLNKYKAEFAIETELEQLSDAMKGADVFLGVSVAGALCKKMAEEMAEKPIIFAMANPTPEITPEEVAEVRDDAIMATGRSDYPNQINNVLGFPFIFRGALDVRAHSIDENMKVAAAKALAQLAKEQAPDYVEEAYGEKLAFGPHYILPKPFDKRVLTRVAPAVAQAAFDSNIARVHTFDKEAYTRQLEVRITQAF